MTKIKHMGVTPLHLMRLPDAQLLEAVEWSGTVEELRAKLRRDGADGIVYPIGDCPDWDPHRGCPGHQVAEPPLISYCGWCGRWRWKHLGRAAPWHPATDPLPWAGRLTHGVCPDCERKLLDEAEDCGCRGLRCPGG